MTGFSCELRMGLVRSASGARSRQEGTLATVARTRRRACPDGRKLCEAYGRLTMERLAGEDDLSQIQGKGHKNAQLESTERPDIHTLDVFPCADSGEARVCQQTKDGIDLEAGVVRPHLAEYSIYDGSETIEEEGETGPREEGKDGRAARSATGDDYGCDR